MSIHDFWRGKYGQVKLCPKLKQLQDLREIAKAVQSIFDTVPQLNEYIKFNFKIQS